MKKATTPIIVKFLSVLGLLILVASCTNQIESPEPIYPVPTERQLAWHEMEQYAFVHFTTNTFTGLEWGYGDESPEVFNPTHLDVDQWVNVFKEAGLNAIILTCKHHDGFCLWPSKYTEHSVKNSPYKDGQGDVVKEVREACERHGLKFGIYLSPWDRNHADYGSSEYIEYYRNQLKELFEGHSPIFEMWFDGANGGDGYYGGANENRTIDKQTYYDWPTTLEMVRGMEPEIIFFSDAGPDIRWCGNERGFVNETNWNTIDSDTLYAGKAGIQGLLNTGTEGAKDWIPAEVDVSIRPGWFYHEDEDDKVKTPEKLFEIYLSSVGRGSNLLLNIPPDKRGIVHENDVEALKGWKKLLDETFKTNRAIGAELKASNVRGKSKQYAASNLIDDNKDTYWATDDEVTSANIEITLKEETQVKYVLLQEYIKLGQRVKKFSVEAWENGVWKNIGSSSTIGYKKILPVEHVKTNKLRINFEESRRCLVISDIKIY